MLGRLQLVSGKRLVRLHAYLKRENMRKAECTRNQARGFRGIGGVLKASCFSSPPRSDSLQSMNLITTLSIESIHKPVSYNCLEGDT